MISVKHLTLFLLYKFLFLTWGLLNFTPVIRGTQADLLTNIRPSSKILSAEY